MADDYYPAPGRQFAHGRTTSSHRSSAPYRVGAREHAAVSRWGGKSTGLTVLNTLVGRGSTGFA